MKLSEMRFTDLGLPSELMQGIDEAGFEYLTEVQARSLPLSLQGKDLAVQSQTGSGKTAAFLLPIFNHFLKEPKRETKGVCPRAIVITPTRELAVQVANDAELLGKHLEFRILLAYGGVDYKKQRQDIASGVDLLVGTPGRLIDYLKQDVYHLRDVEIAVIDEADRMFDLGFITDLRFLMRRMSRFDRRQSMLFSATLSDRVMELSYEYMNIPELIEITPDRVVAERVEQILYHLGSSEKMGFLLGYLQREEWNKALLFINTKREAQRVRDTLELNGYPSAILSGDVTQENRLKTLRKFMHGDLRVLVATDVASRGLHIEGITHVINYDLPQDPEDYVHRIGRTARAGASGKALSLACENYVFGLTDIEAYIGHPIPTGQVQDEWIIDYTPAPRKHDRSRVGGDRGRRSGSDRPSGGRGKPRTGGRRR